MNSADPNRIQEQLEVNGWCLIPAPLSIAAVHVLAALGPILPSLQKGADYVELTPCNKNSAPYASMSAITGTNAQPMHTDSAYYPVPPRFIALLCLEPGEARCPTHVWAVDLERLGRDRPEILTRPNWVSHGGGREPFYCSIMELQSGRIRLRFDPLCMRLVSGDVQAVSEAAKTLDGYCQRITVEWERGSLLIINNWYCLHARGAGADRAPSRRLRRWSIGVNNGLVV